MRGRSVFLVENSPLFQAAIVSILRRLGFSIGTFDPAQEPVQAGARRGKQADLFLVDVVTFSGSLKDLEEAIKRYSRVGPVLLLAREDHIEQVVAGLKAGAVGFVKQTASLSELRNAIKALASGNTFCDRRLFQRIMKYLPVVASSGRPSLTKREEEVLSLVSVAQTNKEIAQRLGVSEQSVKVYVSNLLRKSGATNRSGLALYAVTRGLATGE